MTDSPTPSEALKALRITDPWDLLTPEVRETLQRDLTAMAKARADAMFNARFWRLP